MSETWGVEPNIQFEPLPLDSFGHRPAVCICLARAEVHRCLPSAQDPTRNFEQSTPIASAGATASTAAGDLVLDALDTPLGSYVNVYVVAVQDGGNTTLTGTLSVELALKD
jgi:hypothetical protein